MSSSLASNRVTSVCVVENQQMAVIKAIVTCLFCLFDAMGSMIPKA